MTDEHLPLLVIAARTALVPNMLGAFAAGFIVRSSRLMHHRVVHHRGGHRH